ncbi:MAG TPA: MFS transporter [Rhizobiaceae bacterium]|nr:MFS transporter [Rhizobiaceae bacterium]
MNDAPSIPVHPSSQTFCPPHLRWHVLVAAILASSLGFIDSSVVPIAIPAIRADIGATLPQAQWISSAYLLMVSALVMAGGAAGDRYGLRNVFGGGIVFFLVASLLCAAAPDATFLIAVRALQGLGAAIMIPGSLAIIAKAYPPQERGRAIGIWAAASAATSGLGPVAGGLIIGATGDWGWRLIFAINLPLGLAALALLFKVPADRPEGGRRLDPAGVVLATLALGTMALGLSGGRAAFSSIAPGAPAPDWPMIAAGFVILTAFLWWEKQARQPMMPLSLFADHAFAGANIATFLIYFALSAVLFFLPMTLITAWETSEAQAALTFVPITLLVGVMSGPVGKASARLGPRIFMATGSLICALAYAWVALTMDQKQFWGALMPAMTLMGFGMGVLVSPLSAAVMTAVPDSQTGMASAINNTVARLSGLFAVASLGGVISAVFLAFPGADPLPAFGQTPPAGASAEAVAAWRSASNAAFSVLAFIAAAMCAVAAVVSWVSLDNRQAIEA